MTPPQDPRASGRVDKPSAAGRPRDLPVKRCAECGGTWFRVIDVSLYASDEPRMTAVNWRGESEQISRMPMRVLVCLCGAPLPPRLGGMRGGRTPNAELSSLFHSLSAAERRRPREEEWLTYASETFLQAQELAGLRAAVRALEQRVGRGLAPRDETGGIQKGGNWRAPKRTASSKCKGRDWLAVELQKRGFTFDKARQIIDAIFTAMTEELQAGGFVETALGTFRVVRRRPPECVRVRLGKTLKFNTRRKRVAFQQHREVFHFGRQS